MNKLALTPPPVQPSLSISLAPGPAAPAEARRHIRSAIACWGVAADLDTAMLLTSELVTNAVRYTSGPVRLFVTCSCGQLRVHVHDASRDWAVPAVVSPDAEYGRGLMLVASLAADWGCYRTSAGKAVYFTLALESAQA